MSAANPLAVKAGVYILASGSAMDAAIAVQMVLNLVEPQSSGIGGGAFMLYLDKATSNILAYDGRETALSAAPPRTCSWVQMASLWVSPPRWTEACQWAHPGLPRMLEAAYQAHGKLPWADLFAPAIALAESGFAVSERMSVSIAGSAARIKAQGEPGASYFLKADGTAKTTGTRLKMKRWRRPRKAIAVVGPMRFTPVTSRGDIGGQGHPPPHQPRPPDAG